jgi:tRNA(Arg) A34 adenosine deaminase TadA
MSSRPDVDAFAPDPSDDEFLARAVLLAAENGDAGRLPFGALVVRDDDVLATGVNTEQRDLDPTAHAEVAAIRAACARLGTLLLAGATVVSSCEPCAICHAVATAAGVRRILYAAPKELIPDLGGDPAPEGVAELMPRMQGALRAIAPEQIIHVPTPGAVEPFRRYLAAKERTA